MLHTHRFNVAALLLSTFAISYGIQDSGPRLLEAPDSDEDYEPTELVFPRYKPFNPPRSMEQANNMLREEEASSSICGSVVRYDRVIVPSNYPLEDAMLQAQAVDHNGELVWFISGVFDGHE